MRMRIGAALLCVGLTAVQAWACDVPVFEWALENWEPDSHQVFVFHRGALSAGDRALLDAFRADVEEAHANLDVTMLDVAAPLEEAARRVWEGQSAGRLPWAVVQSPTLFGEMATLWAGPLDELDTAALLDSPARRELARDLLEGRPTAWLLLESGNEDADAAAAEQLENALAAIDVSAMSEGLAAPDTPGFSVVRVGRDDPAEQVLVGMLLRTEPDLPDFDAPMAFPVYGRGRALYALVGKGINADTVREAGSFLLGRCSCLVKDMNPGTDLLMAVDWEGRVAGGTVIQALAAAEPAEGPPDTRAGMSLPDFPEDPVPARGPWPLLLAFVPAFLVVGAASFWTLRKRKHT